MLSRVLPRSANAVMSAILYVVPAPYPCSTRAHKNIRIARYFFPMHSRKVLMPSKLARGKSALAISYRRPDSMGSLVVACIIDARDNASGVHKGSISCSAARGSIPICYARSYRHLGKFPVCYRRPRQCIWRARVQYLVSCRPGQYTFMLRTQLAPPG